MSWPLSNDDFYLIRRHTTTPAQNRIKDRPIQSISGTPHILHRGDG